MAVGPDGVLYANSWSGGYYDGDTGPGGGFLIALRDRAGTGTADLVQRFGDTARDGSAGGTGVAFYKNAVYAEENDRIVRYALAAGETVPSGKPATVLSGLPLGGDHPMHPFIIDASGNLFVDVGSATNSCQSQNRQADVPGNQPCRELAERAGTWRYSADKLDQHFSPAERFATGLRNGEGFAFDASGRLYATQHGRDQLGQNWSKFYSIQQNADLPAEELVHLVSGGDYGWPECYFDGFQKKLVLAPEYGGDGGKAVGICAEKLPPVAAFPAHWAPNDLLIYSGSQFPEAYRGGAFIAFHGSWNRAPEAQGGYNVVFQPLSDGKAAGTFAVFADGFAGAHMEPGRAAYRPTGLAQAADGALYISDDVQGRIWRVTYSGPAGTTITAAAPVPSSPGGSAAALPPEGIQPDAGSALPTPPGVTAAEVALGDRIYHQSTCSGCHGSDGGGSALGPNLMQGRWVWGNGSLAALATTITNGVPKPRNHTGAMPAKGGADLSMADIKAVAAYVWALGHQANQ
jgi:glucose/arabinose dehydrogenase/cytochrome c5